MEHTSSHDLMVVDGVVDPPPIRQQKPKLVTCHQCRTPRKRENVVLCMGKRLRKACPLKYCNICLDKRYKLKAFEIALRTNWICPKCLGKCNCSQCLIRLGKTPTGKVDQDLLVAMFNSSVSELPKTEESVAEPGQGSSVGEQHINVCDSIENLAENENKSKRINISDFVDEIKLTNEENNSGKDIKGEAIVGRTTDTNSAIKRKDEYETEVKLPEGSSSIAVYGIDLPHEVVGDVFQFMEFSARFENALNLPKGHSESVIREVLSGRSSRRPQYFILTQLLIHLLTMILEDRGKPSVSMTTTDETWFIVLGECYKESGLKLDCFPADMFEKGIVEYENMDSSKRLKLLNFLCDETLNTSVMRNIIDEHALQSIEKEKEVKKMIKKAKQKEKQLNFRLKNELAKAKKEKGMSLSFSERCAIVSRMNAEKEEVQSEMQNAILMKESHNSDKSFTRINPIAKDDNGRIFWKLKSNNEEENILLQDLSTWNRVYPSNEKWFTFKSDQKIEIEKYLSSIRTISSKEE